MRAYVMQGTPTLLLIDRQGRLRLNHFGHLDDMRLGAAITTLIAEGAGQPLPASDAEGPVCRVRSEEHTSELQSLMRISYAVFCLKNKKPHKLRVKLHVSEKHKR